MWVGEVEVYAPGEEPPAVVEPPLRADQGMALQIPLEPTEKVFYSKDNKANFTSFAGVEDITVEDGMLKFTLASPTATLGWGNFQGKHGSVLVLPLSTETSCREGGRGRLQRRIVRDIEAPLRAQPRRLALLDVSI